MAQQPPAVQSEVIPEPVQEPEQPQVSEQSVPAEPHETAWQSPVRPAPVVNPEPGEPKEEAPKDDSDDIYSIRNFSI